ncbi:MAG TPA: hypothetical protein VGN14_13835, partial [Candidatus Elarobacter sp.]
GSGASLSAVVSRANVAPSSGEPAPIRGDVPLRAAVAPPGDPTSIETRLATSRAATTPPRAAVPPTAGPVRTTAPAVPPAPNAISRTTIPPFVAQRFVPPPPIATRATAAPHPVEAQPAVRAVPPAAASATPVPSARTAAAYAEPVALLRALRLPVTPSNVAAATMALDKPERLPVALAALERALPRIAADPHVATLRALLPFVGRIDPRSPALAAQIAAYVEHVVDGAEPKLATLLAAARFAEPQLPENLPASPPSAPAPAAAAAAPQPPTAPPQPSAPRDATSPAPARTAPSGSTAEPVRVAALPAAVVVERTAALGADLKQTLMVMAADPATPAATAPALAGAISALTAMQVSAAQTLAANPGGIAFTIPLATEHGPQAARISVSRDGAQPGGGRVDGDNFRIAFVLDTAHYGTVAIDLVTVGRDVTVDVRAESAPAMRAFRDALGQLSARLETLRYRVAAIGATVGITSTVGVAAAPAAPADPDAVVDRSV